MGQININIPIDSQRWLFTQGGDPDDGRLWSMGRFKPRVEPGDDILFHFGDESRRRIVAAATVDEVYKPGLLDNWCHNGKRYLSGWKLTWLNRSFIDLREVRPELHIACNDERGDDRGRFEQAQLLLNRLDEVIELDGGSMTFREVGAHTMRIGRRKYAIGSRSNYVGNLHWDAVTIDLFTAADILNQLLAADFGITCGPTSLCDKVDAGEPIGWRDLLAVVQEAVA